VRVFIDLDTRGFIESDAFPRPVTELTLKRGDNVPVELSFVRGNVITELAAEASGKIGLKPKGQFGSAFYLAMDAEWEKSGSAESTKYSWSLDLATNEIASAFLAEPESVLAMLEVEWVENGLRTSSATLDVEIQNDVNRGNEGIPTSGTPVYPEPQEVLTKSGNLTGIANPAAARAVLGLENVENTSDADKPVSDAAQEALDLKAPLASPQFTGTPTAPTAAPGTNTTQIATTAHVKAAIDALVASAPGTLDTLNELAAALGDDANFAATVTSALALKAPLGSAMGVVVHGSNPSAARPAGYAVVTWVGSVEPANAISNDIWEETT
jgi:hypothetical protein